MKKKWVLTLIVVVIGVIVLKLAYNMKINQEVTGNVYVDGVVVGETTIQMQGEKSRYLFSEEQKYTGYFYIAYYERTCREDMSARITWKDEFDMQRIVYSQNASFPSLDLHTHMIIDEEMKDFALGFIDGTVIATSEDMYQSYISSL